MCSSGVVETVDVLSEMKISDCELEAEGVMGSSFFVSVAGVVEMNNISVGSGKQGMCVNSLFSNRQIGRKDGASGSVLLKSSNFLSLSVSEGPFMDAYGTNSIWMCETVFSNISVERKVGGHRNVGRDGCQTTMVGCCFVSMEDVFYGGIVNPGCCTMSHLNSINNTYTNINRVKNANQTYSDVEGHQSLNCSGSFEDDTFINCSATSGGAISISGLESALTATRCQFQKCSARNNGGAISGERMLSTRVNSSVFNNISGGENTSIGYGGYGSGLFLGDKFVECFSTTLSKRLHHTLKGTQNEWIPLFDTRFVDVVSGDDEEWTCGMRADQPCKTVKGALDHSGEEHSWVVKVGSEITYESGMEIGGKWLFGIGAGRLKIRWMNVSVKMAGWVSVSVFVMSGDGELRVDESVVGCVCDGEDCGMERAVFVLGGGETRIVSSLIVGMRFRMGGSVFGMSGRARVVMEGSEVSGVVKTEGNGSVVERVVGEGEVFEFDNCTVRGTSTENTVEFVGCQAGSGGGERGGRGGRGGGVYLRVEDEDVDLCVKNVGFVENRGEEGKDLFVESGDLKGCVNVKRFVHVKEWSNGSVESCVGVDEKWPDVMIPLVFYVMEREERVVVGSGGHDVSACGFMEYPCRSVWYSMEQQGGGRKEVVVVGEYRMEENEKRAEVVVVGSTSGAAGVVTIGGVGRMEELGLVLEAELAEEGMSVASVSGDGGEVEMAKCTVRGDGCENGVGFSFVRASGGKVTLSELEVFVVAGYEESRSFVEVSGGGCIVSVRNSSVEGGGGGAGKRSRFLKSEGAGSVELWNSTLRGIVVGGGDGGIVSGVVGLGQKISIDGGTLNGVCMEGNGGGVEVVVSDGGTVEVGRRLSTEFSLCSAGMRNEGGGVGGGVGVGRGGFGGGMMVKMEEGSREIYVKTVKFSGCSAGKAGRDIFMEAEKLSEVVDSERMGWITNVSDRAGAMGYENGCEHGIPLVLYLQPEPSVIAVGGAESWDFERCGYEGAGCRTLDYAMEKRGSILGLRSTIEMSVSLEREHVIGEGTVVVEGKGAGCVVDVGGSGEKKQDELVVNKATTTIGNVGIQVPCGLNGRRSFVKSIGGALTMRSVVVVAKEGSMVGFRIVEATGGSVILSQVEMSGICFGECPFCEARDEGWVTVSSCTVSGCSTTCGGGLVHVEGGGSMSVQGSELTGVGRVGGGRAVCGKGGKSVEILNSNMSLWKVGDGDGGAAYVEVGEGSVFVWKGNVVRDSISEGGCGGGLKIGVEGSGKVRVGQSGVVTKFVGCRALKKENRGGCGGGVAMEFIGEGEVGRDYLVEGLTFEDNMAERGAKMFVEAEELWRVVTAESVKVGGVEAAGTSNEHVGFDKGEELDVPLWVCVSEWEEPGYVGEEGVDYRVCGFERYPCGSVGFAIGARFGVGKVHIRLVESYVIRAEIVAERQEVDIEGAVEGAGVGVARDVEGVESVSRRSLFCCSGGELCVEKWEMEAEGGAATYCVAECTAGLMTLRNVTVKDVNILTETGVVVVVVKGDGAKGVIDLLVLENITGGGREDWWSLGEGQQRSGATQQLGHGLGEQGEQWGWAGGGMYLVLGSRNVKYSVKMVEFGENEAYEGKNAYVVCADARALVNEKWWSGSARESDGEEKQLWVYDEASGRSLSMLPYLFPADEAIVFVNGGRGATQRIAGRRAKDSADCGEWKGGWGGEGKGRMADDSGKKETRALVAVGREGHLELTGEAGMVGLMLSRLRFCLPCTSTHGEVIEVRAGECSIVNCSFEAGEEGAGAGGGAETTGMGMWIGRGKMGNCSCGEAVVVLRGVKRGWIGNGSMVDGCVSSKGKGGWLRWEASEEEEEEEEEKENEKEEEEGEVMIEGIEVKGCVAEGEEGKGGGIWMRLNGRKEGELLLRDVVFGRNRAREGRDLYVECESLNRTVKAEWIVNVVCGEGEGEGEVEMRGRDREHFFGEAVDLMMFVLQYVSRSVCVGRKGFDMVGCGSTAYPCATFWRGFMNTEASSEKKEMIIDGECEVRRSYDLSRFVIRSAGGASGEEKMGTLKFGGGLDEEAGGGGEGVVRNMEGLKVEKIKFLVGAQLPGSKGCVIYSYSYVGGVELSESIVEEEMGVWLGFSFVVVECGELTVRGCVVKGIWTLAPVLKVSVAGSGLIENTQFEDVSIGDSSVVEVVGTGSKGGGRWNGENRMAVNGCSFVGLKSEVGGEGVVLRGSVFGEVVVNGCKVEDVGRENGGEWNECEEVYVREEEWERRRMYLMCTEALRELPFGVKNMIFGGNEAWMGRNMFVVAADLNGSVNEESLNVLLEGMGWDEKSFCGEDEMVGVVDLLMFVMSYESSTVHVSTRGLDVRRCGSEKEPCKTFYGGFMHIGGEGEEDDGEKKVVVEDARGDGEVETGKKAILLMENGGAGGESEAWMENRGRLGIREIGIEVGKGGKLELGKCEFVSESSANMPGRYSFVVCMGGEMEAEEVRVKDVFYERSVFVIRGVRECKVEKMHGSSVSLWGGAVTLEGIKRNGEGASVMECGTSRCVDVEIVGCVFEVCVSSESEKGGMMMMCVEEGGRIGVRKSEVRQCSCSTRNGKGGGMYVRSTVEGDVEMMFSGIEFESNTAHVGRDMFIECHDIGSQINETQFKLVLSSEVYNQINAIYGMDECEHALEPVNLLEFIMTYQADTIFVSGSGAGAGLDTKKCGSRALPCASIGYGLGHMTKIYESKLVVDGESEIESEIELAEVGVQSKWKEQAEVHVRSGMKQTKDCVVESVGEVELEQLVFVFSGSFVSSHKMFMEVASGTAELRSIGVSSEGEAGVGRVPFVLFSIGSGEHGGESGMKMWGCSIGGISCEHALIEIGKCGSLMATEVVLKDIECAKSLVQIGALSGNVSVKEVEVKRAKLVEGAVISHQRDKLSIGDLLGERCIRGLELVNCTCTGCTSEAERKGCWHLWSKSCGDGCMLVCTGRHTKDGERGGMGWRCVRVEWIVGGLHRLIGDDERHNDCECVVWRAVDVWGSVTIVKGEFINNNPSMAKYPSMRRNVLCSGNGMVDVQSLKGGDGMQPSTSLWIMDGGCELMGIPAERASALFIPRLETVNMEESGKEMKLILGGMLLLPCNLSVRVVSAVGSTESLETYELEEEAIVSETEAHYWIEKAMICSAPAEAEVSVCILFETVIPARNEAKDLREIVNDNIRKDPKAFEMITMEMSPEEQWRRAEREAEKKNEERIKKRVYDSNMEHSESSEHLLSESGSTEYILGRDSDKIPEWALEKEEEEEIRKRTPSPSISSTSTTSTTDSDSTFVRMEDMCPTTSSMSNLEREQTASQILFWVASLALHSFDEMENKLQSLSSLSPHIVLFSEHMVICIVMHSDFISSDDSDSSSISSSTVVTSASDDDDDSDSLPPSAFEDEDDYKKECLRDDAVGCLTLEIPFGEYPAEVAGQKIANGERPDVARAGSPDGVKAIIACLSMGRYARPTLTDLKRAFISHFPAGCAVLTVSDAIGLEETTDRGKRESGSAQSGSAQSGSAQSGSLVSGYSTFE
ncbi:uncharacterized protein MONOS_17469 [Monocercomonoides exilis]|uniref:uncharacterized protein n=1 Tax=Monocercomonoides exilis TaxID=2049356 RepID=UPI003559636F|nr:hypothetical protein MONOS_17469 [Monocercomonoides exilis]